MAFRSKSDDDDDRTASLAARLYATQEKRLKPLPEKFMRRSVCRFWKEGNCNLPSGKCTWAHGEHEIGTLIEIIPGVDDRPEPKREKRELTPQELTLLARLEMVAQERDRLAAMENAKSQGGLSSLAGVLSAANAGAGGGGQDLAELQAAADLQVYQQHMMQNAGQGNLAEQLMEVEARGTPSHLAQLQAKATAVGTFGFGVGPLGEMDLMREFSSPLMGKGINRIPKQPVIATSRVYMGIVKAFYASQKHGRIECEEIRAAAGCDVYIYQDVLARCQAGVGDVINFSVHTSARGQLQASSPLVRVATHLGYAQTGVFRTGGPCDHKTDVGTVDCPEIRRVFGTEARVPKEIGKGLIFGRRVAFNSYMNNEGRVYVVSVEEVDESYTPTPGNLSVSYSMPAFASLEQSAAGVPGQEAFVPFDPTSGGLGGPPLLSAGPSRAEMDEKRRICEERKGAYLAQKASGGPATLPSAVLDPVAALVQAAQAAMLPEVAALQAALAAPVLDTPLFEDLFGGKGGKRPTGVIPPGGGFEPKAAMPQAGVLPSTDGGAKRQRLDGPRFVGTINNMIAKDGGAQGSIMCDELFLRFGKPVTVREDDVVSGILKPGAKVRFSLEDLGGQPFARNCEVSDAAAGGTVGLWPAMGGMA